MKDKKGITTTNAFQKNLDESKRKPDKIWADKDSEFYNRSMKSWLQDNNIEINRLIKEMNRLLSKRISNIYLKVTIEMFSKLRFSGFTKFVTRSVFGELQLTQISLKNVLLQLKNQTSGSQTMCGFSIFLILKGIMTF